MDMDIASENDPRSMVGPEAPLHSISYPPLSGKWNAFDFLTTPQWEMECIRFPTHPSVGNEMHSSIFSSMLLRATHGQRFKERMRQMKSPTRAMVLQKSTSAPELRTPSGFVLKTCGIESLVIVALRFQFE